MSDELIGSIYSVVVQNGGGIKFTDLMNEILKQNAKKPITGLHNVGDLDISQIIYNCVNANDMLRICEFATHPSFNYIRYFVYIPVTEKKEKE